MSVGQKIYIYELDRDFSGMPYAYSMVFFEVVKPACIYFTAFCGL